jgi:hypothetical protein
MELIILLAGVHPGPFCWPTEGRISIDMLVSISVSHSHRSIFWVIDMDPTMKTDIFTGHISGLRLVSQYFLLQPPRNHTINVRRPLPKRPMSTIDLLPGQIRNKVHHIF